MASLGGKTVVFTGFRDKALEADIVAGGGRVATSVSLQTDILVASGVKGVESVNAKKARAQGVRVVSRADFAAEFFPPSLWDRVRGKKLSARGKQEETCYLTLDNGGQAFKVCYNDQRFWVFKPNVALDDEGYDDENVVHGLLAVKPTKYTRAFVGRSPKNRMTKSSGGHGAKFDGNSMLFELDVPRTPSSRSRAYMYTYMFIGDTVGVFSTVSPVASFVSPVGNSGVPYPFAVDRSGVAYLLIEGVQIVQMKGAAGKGAAGNKAPDDDDDPYGYYYDRATLTPPIPHPFLTHSSPIPSDVSFDVFEGITAFYIGSKQYTLTYVPAPEKNFERIIRFGETSKKRRAADDKRPTRVYVVAHGEKKELVKREYASLMRRVGKQRGFANLKIKVLVPRQ